VIKSIQAKAIKRIKKSGKGGRIDEIPCFFNSSKERET